MEAVHRCAPARSMDHVITDAERNRDADRKDIHPHPHSRPFRQADHRLPEGEAAGGERNNIGRQRRQNAEQDVCGDVPGNGKGGMSNADRKNTGNLEEYPRR